MGTQDQYARPVARAKWTPPNGEVAARIDALVSKYKLRDQIEAECKADLAVLADPDGDAVPIAALAERLGVERKTIYRHLGRSMT